MKESFVQEFLEFFEWAPSGTVKALTAKVLEKCRQLTSAEAGTIFIVRGRGKARRLEAVHTQNDAIKAKSNVFVVPIDVGSIAGYAAAKIETVWVDDVDSMPEGVPYKFNRSYDLRTGFRTRSMLAFPLTTPEGRITGVVQLINALKDGEAVPFDRRFAKMVAPVSNIVGRIIERMVANEELARRNKELTKRNSELRVERARVVNLQAETERTFQMTLQALAKAAELNDEDTSAHVKRVSEYCFVLARVAGQEKAFCDEIRWASALHDVGKMSIDHGVLNKRGRLDEREFAEMQRHTTAGYEILAGYPRLAMAADIAHAHHEMWEGGGYPRRLRGEEIPLAARFVTIADVYDALRSARSYKPSFSHERTVDIILRGDDRLHPASHFDPRLLAVFGRYHDRFAHIWETVSDQPKDAALVAGAA
jgi:HD-GYP domain-containing protein (c-di-GMP phosphodiesterase class II)